VAVAAAVMDIEGHAVGAVCVSVPAGRMDLMQAHGLSAPVIGAARAVSHNAGGQQTSLQPTERPAPGSAAAVSCVHEAASLLGEGPMWSSADNALYWVDILTPAVHRFDVASGSDSAVMLGAMVSAAVPKASGGLLLATPAGLMSFSFATRGLQPFCHPEAGRSGNRYNDGKCDRMGRLWVGTLDIGGAPNRGRLYRVDGDAGWQLMDDGFSVANGLGWSPDNRHMYFTDSGRRTIYVYDFDLRSGSIANRRPLIVLPPDDGTPDGMTVDDEGCLWIAIWDAWRISRHAADGRELMRVRLPVPRPTSCCFGGDQLDTLFVTSASLRLGTAALQQAPLSGSLFAVRVPGVHGLPETVFAA
jgi:sugar lactone lactonase YvrE